MYVRPRIRLVLTLLAALCAGGWAEAGAPAPDATVAGAWGLSHADAVSVFDDLAARPCAPSVARRTAQRFGAPDPVRAVACVPGWTKAPDAPAPHCAGAPENRRDAHVRNCVLLI